MEPTVPSDQVSNLVEQHELFTRLLFVDALIGLGVPANQEALRECVNQGLVTFRTSVKGDRELAFTDVWQREALEALGLQDLQDLYTGLKYMAVMQEAQ